MTEICVITDWVRLPLIQAERAKNRQILILFGMMYLLIGVFLGLYYQSLAGVSLSDIGWFGCFMAGKDGAAIPPMIDNLATSLWIQLGPTMLWPVLLALVLTSWLVG